MVFSDRDGDGRISRNLEDLEIRNVEHYYPFGMKMDRVEDNPMVGPKDQTRYKYNGIEHFDEMNLDWDFATYRMLDPGLGRWQQVDPKATAAYGMSPYCSMGNSPMTHVDPDGDIAILAGAAMSGLSYYFQSSQYGQFNWNDFAKSAVIGGFSGGLTAGVGTAASVLSPALGTYGTAAVQVVAHAGIQGGASALQGGDFWQGAATGAASSAIGSGIGLGGSALGWSDNAIGVVQIGGAGLSGGITSTMMGGSFIQGLGQGLVVGALNHAAHEVFGGGDPPTEEQKQNARLHAADLFTSGEISRKTYINAIVLIDNGSWALIKRVLWSSKVDIALSVFPGARLGRVVQKGGQTIAKGTLNALGLSKGQARTGIESLKRANGLPNNFHGRITKKGYYLHPNKDINYGRIHDYID